MSEAEAARTGLTREHVARLARLARLALDEAELDALTDELGSVLEAVAVIREVTDALDVPPTTHAVPLVNVTRSDDVRPCLPRAAALAGAPDVQDGRFRVPRVLDSS